MNLITTKRGPLAWIARKFDLLIVNCTIQAGEADRVQMEMDLLSLPRRLRVLDNDLADLRVRQAILRSTR